MNVIERTFKITTEIVSQLDTATSIAFANGRYYRVNGETLTPLTEIQVILTVVNTENGTLQHPMYDAVREWISSY